MPPIARGTRTYPDVGGRMTAEAAARGGRRISQAQRRPAPHRPAVFRRQAAQQLDVRARSSSWSCPTRRSSTRGAIRSAVACRISASISRAGRISPTTSTDLGRYYSDYVRLMAHIDAVLPGRVHRVIYERMVDDTETRGAGAARTIAGWSSSQAASNSTRPSARFARQARSRCASRSTATPLTNGGATRRISGRSRRRSARCSIATRSARDLSATLTQQSLRRATTSR